MKFLIVALSALALASAGVIPEAGRVEQEVIPGVATDSLVQGPSTRTRLVGPDGSQIVADAPGGTIVTNEEPAVAAVPVAVAPVVEVAHPVVEVAQPVVEVVARTIAEPIVAAPVISNTVVEEVAAPVIAPVVAGPVVARAVVASPVGASGYPLLAAGSGLEGQYVPDNTEQLYDDGSYKGDGEGEEH